MAAPRGRIDAPARSRPVLVRIPAPARVVLVERLAGWVRTHRRSLLIVGVLVAVVAVVYGRGLSHYPARVDDEGTYVAQAWAFQHWHVLSHYTYWYDHPPLGWMLIAAWAWVTDGWGRVPFAVLAGRQAMVAAHLVSCALLYLLARRLGVGRAGSATAVALFSFSPLALEYHRMVYLDNLATPFLLAAFVLAASPHRRLLGYAGCGVCFAAAVLTKETTVLLLPALAWQLWHGSDRRNRDFSVALFTVLFLLVVAIYPLYALLKGELLAGPGHVSLMDGIRFQLTRPGTGAVWKAGSIAHQQVTGWLHQDPWLLVGGAVATMAALFVPRLRAVAIASLTLLVLLLRTGYLPIPYVIGLLPFAALGVAGVADEVARWIRSPAGAHMRPGVGGAGRGLAAAGLAVVMLVAGVVGPGWVRSDAQAMARNPDARLAGAENWIIAHLPRNQSVLVTDTMWIDMVRAGWSPGVAIWFYKLDTDPAVQREFPRGWRSFTYVISTDEMRGSARGRLPEVEAALAHSTVVRTFGAGGAAIEVRRITPP